MTPGTRLALAYAHLTGYLPKHIQISTWASANDLLEGSVNRKTVKAEALPQVKSHPMARAGEFLTERGFTVSGWTSQGKRTTHYVKYDHPSGLEGLAGRLGWVTIVTVNNERPYRTNENFTPAQVARELACPTTARLGDPGLGRF